MQTFRYILVWDLIAKNQATREIEVCYENLVKVERHISQAKELFRTHEEVAVIQQEEFWRNHVQSHWRASLSSENQAIRQQNF